MPLTSTPLSRRQRWFAAGASACLALAAAQAGMALRPQAVAAAAPPEANRMQMERQPDFAKMQAVGEAMFFDRGLSASGRVSCASCHDPAHAFGPSNALDVQPGGRDGRTIGTRAAPSLRYQQNVPPFTMHRFDDDFDESEDQGAAGGHNWDGRARTLHEQAAIPLLARHEMANASPAEVVTRLRAAPYAAQFRETFGQDALDDEGRAFQWATLALEMFQQDPAKFYPYSSRYDDYLRGKAKLSAAEMRGLALFNAENKGNCASCHVSQVSANTGAFPAFSDFGLIALGVPRNRALPANRDPAFHDLGACGPDRTDIDPKANPELCGAFRTPSLRNVAVRQSFFHNGLFHSLEDVVRFYVERDVAPQRWYPGKAHRPDDLPAAYAENLNMDPPFGGKRGGRPALDEAEIRDIVAFLRTLTDKDMEPAAQALTQRSQPARIAHGR
ncbi:cytochrome-c peroxidase [Xylophilus sp.]|uniref:cytochrome-c peroxidase n=1 Tax=Xylophilus sp. TaxID=2653893 RepID=UPI0013B72993|nr:cytochrome c peroxidase [Xylophilus sp.]KAF1043738.1 MAG: Methylamine utilization protein MauG [Xylophilus sp.]